MVLPLLVPLTQITYTHTNSHTCVRTRIPNQVHWGYDTFVNEIYCDNISRVDIQQDQKLAHIFLKDGVEKEILLPTSQSHDDIELLLQHEIPINIIPVPKAPSFSAIDIVLFIMQTIMLSRFVIIDWMTKKNNTTQNTDKKPENIATQQHNDLLITMGGTVAEDILTTSLTSVPPTNVGHVLRIGYQVAYNSQDSIDEFVGRTFRKYRVAVHRVKRVVARSMK